MAAIDRLMHPGLYLEGRCCDSRMWAHIGFSSSKEPFNINKLAVITLCLLCKNPVKDAMRYRIVGSCTYTLMGGKSQGEVLQQTDSLKEGELINGELSSWLWLEIAVEKVKTQEIPLSLTDKAYLELLKKVTKLDMKLFQAEEWIKAKAQYRAYYEAMYTKFVELGLAYKSLASGEVKRAENTKRDLLGTGILIGGSLLSLTPISFPFSGVGKVVQQGIKLGVDKERGAFFRKMSSLFVDARAISIAGRLLAIQCITSYKEQLDRCSERGARVFGECGVGRLVIYWDKERPDVERDLSQLSQKFFQGMHSVKTRQGKKLALPRRMKMGDVTIPFLQTPIETAERLEWNEKGLYERTGIQLINGDRFSKRGTTNTRKYGYRLGSASEVEGWTQVRSA